MKKFYLLTMLLLFAFFTNAQITVQGVPRNDIKKKPNSGTQLNKTVTTTTAFNLSDVQYWVGTGSNEAAFIVQWNDSKNPDALVWGFRWDGTATGEDMMKAIAKADHRFFSLLYQGTSMGTAVGGFGFDLDGQGTNGLYKEANTTYPLYPLNGIVNTSTYDFDKYTGIDTNDHWRSGWLNGYWSYWAKDPADADFQYSPLGVSNRILENGSLNLWNYYAGMNEVPIATTFTPVSPYVSQTSFTNGFFMVNEEWFGHTNGSVNFIDNNGNITYRAYSNANNSQSFGATTQYGTIYGDKFYFISKQAADGGDTQYTPGGRLVIADPVTMQKIVGFNTIGAAGDGRSFLGVNEHTGYIGGSAGIVLFNIDQLQVGSLIAGTSGKGQIGNMIRTSQYVFVVTQTGGILVINPNTHTVVSTIPGTFYSIVQAKDGSIWAAQQQKLINIHPVTFATTEYPIPTTKYFGDWSAWYAGRLTYSNQQNALYWINSINAFSAGSQIVKFDVAAKTFNETFAAIPGQGGTFRQIPYGAALRINPITDELILNTTESGGSAHFQKNWVHTFNNTGNLINTKKLNDYYWFPSVTVFPDNNAPVVSNTFPSQVTVNNAAISIDLKSIVSDVDNLSLSIVKSVKSNSSPVVVNAVINTNDELVLTPQISGTASLVISFNSNGKVVEKTLAVTVSTSSLATAEIKKLEFGIYPNPVTDILTIKTQDKIVSVSLYDASGKLINAPFNNGQINVSMLPKGVYILHAKTDKAVYQQKVIKK